MLVGFFATDLANRAWGEITAELELEEQLALSSGGAGAGADDEDAEIDWIALLELEDTPIGRFSRSTAR